MDSIKYPQHEALRQVQGKTQAIHDFLEFLEEKNIELVKEPNGGSWRLTRRERDDLMAEYFEIDLKALEEEKVAMIDLMRKGNP